MWRNAPIGGETASLRGFGRRRASRDATIAEEACELLRRAAMVRTVGDHLLERIAEQGTRTVFGYPGDGINGIMGAFNRDARGIRFVQARHEEMAAFEACGYAKFSADVGVCLATSGPGAIHLLNGLYDAKMDRVPVVAFIGQAARTAMGGNYQQEVDLQNLFKDVASAYIVTVMSSDQLRFAVDRAFRIAKSERTVTCIILPKDVQELDAVETPPHRHDTLHSSAGYEAPRVIPTDAALQRAADILNAGERVAILAGAGAKDAQDELLLVQDLLGAGIAKALLGRAVVSDYLPFVTGAIGLLGTKPTWDLMQECDTLLMVGSSFPSAEFLPKEGAARGIQIDVDARQIGIRYPMEVNLVGDAKLTLGKLAPLLTRRTKREWQKKDRSQRGRVVATDGGPRQRGGEAAEPAKSILGAVSQAAGRRDAHVRLWLLRKLVCP